MSEDRNRLQITLSNTARQILDTISAKDGVSKSSVISNALMLYGVKWNEDVNVFGNINKEDVVVEQKK